MSAEPLEWVDTADFLAAVSAKNLIKRGQEFSFSCFGEHHAHGDLSPSAGMNARTTLWRCRNPACGLHGNAADYLAAYSNIPRTEAMRALEERYGGPGISTAPGELTAHVERIRASYENIDQQRVRPREEWYRANLQVDWPEYPDSYELGDPMSYMLGRGFSPQILNTWQIGYDPLSDRVTIPVRDVDGTLVGVKARAWRDGVYPKYLVLGHQFGEDLHRYPFNTYEKSRYVYGADRVGGDGHAVGVLVEGELNVVAWDQMSAPETMRAVGIAGAEFSDRQRQIVTSLFDEVYVYFDDDSAGRVGAQKVSEMLEPHLVVHVVQAHADAAEVIAPMSPATRHDLVQWFRVIAPRP